MCIARDFRIALQHNAADQASSLVFDQPLNFQRTGRPQHVTLRFIVVGKTGTVKTMVHRIGACALAVIAGVQTSQSAEMLPAFNFETAIIAAPGKSDLPPLMDVVIAPAAAEPEIRASFGDRYFRRVAVPELGPYSGATFWNQASSVPLELAALTAQPLVQGFTKWNWGKDEFHFTSEGFFGTDTKYLGIDKLGHAYGTYVYSDVLTQRIAQNSDNHAGAALTGSVLGLAIQFGVEVGDGFSPDQGFSPQDMMFNTLGAGFSLLRNSVPGLADKLDFRYSYWKSEFSPFDPSADYSGQKYLLALKLSGFEAFEESPMRFLELHAGYYARGVGDSTVGNGVARRREPYIGIGLNLQQLIKESPADNTTPGLFAGRLLEYYQPPFTSASADLN